MFTGMPNIPMGYSTGTVGQQGIQGTVGQGPTSSSGLCMGIPMMPGMQPGMMPGFQGFPPYMGMGTQRIPIIMKPNQSQQDDKKK